MAFLACPHCEGPIEITIKGKVKKEAKLTWRDEQGRTALQNYMDWVLTAYYGCKIGSEVPEEKQKLAAAYRRFIRIGKGILGMAGGSSSRAKAGTEAVVARMASIGLSCEIWTVEKHFLNWARNPKEYENETASKTTV